MFISDTHGRHRHLRLPPGDILVHGGDIVDAYPTYGALKKDNSLDHQEAQLRDFLKWLSIHASRYKHVVIIPGNHDVILDKSKFKVRGSTVCILPWMVLMTTSSRNRPLPIHQSHHHLAPGSGHQAPQEGSRSQELDRVGGARSH